MNNLFVRIASGIVFLIIMTSCILLNQYTFLILFSFILIGSLNEFYNITLPKREESSSFWTGKWTIIAMCAVIYLFSYVLASPPVRSLPDPSNKLKALFSVIMMQRDSALALSVLVPILILKIIGSELFSKRENPFTNIGWNVVAVGYILVPLILTNNIYFSNGGFFLMAVFILIWVYDSAAYAFGSVLGRHKLFERISPKKTVEGLVGGILFTGALAYFIPTIVEGLKGNQAEWVTKALIPQLSALSGIQWILLTVIIILAATFGDLAESLLKRSLKIKDSGSIMPGHGGFLDRFDAYLFTVPYVALMLWVFNQVNNLSIMIDYISK
ncbi:MAG: phosphatidate cytidylyltransferase [Chitinophagales bacterium]